MPKRRMAHATTRAIFHLAILHVIPRVRKDIVIAGVIVMHVGQDDVFNLRKIDARGLEAVGGRPCQLTRAPRRHVGVETGIDHDGPAASLQHPDEEIHRHRPVMRIATEKILGPMPLGVVGVANRQYFVFHHWILHTYR